MYNKELLKGTLSTIVLNLLQKEGKMYGYEIAQRVKELSSEHILLKDGSLYPALHKMTKDGLLSFEEVYIGKRVRKYYYLTSAGTKKGQQESEQLKAFMSTLRGMLFPDFTFKTI
jgi:DNA-binding PadR family transcriptional regulator